jgi:hypothetical protein
MMKLFPDFDDFLSCTVCSFGDDSPPPTQQITTNNTPWHSSALQKGIDSAQTVLDTPQSYYSGQTYANFDPLQTQSQNNIVDRANMGAPNIDAANTMVGDTLDGTYLNQGNPAYAAMVDRATRPMIDTFQNQTVPTINSDFAGAGRYGSGIARQGQLDRQADILSRNVGDISANLAYQNYGTERQMMGAAAQMAPGLEQAAYIPDQMLDQVGGVRQGMAQNAISQDINKFNFGQNEEANRIGRYMGLVGGGYGGQSTSVQPVQGNNGLMQMAGLASMGIGAANTLFNPKMGLFPR